MRNHLARGLVGAAVAAMLIVAGCGDDDSDSDGTTKAGGTSKAEYIARSNAICDRTQGAAGKAFGRIVGKGRPTPAEAQRFLAQGVVPAIRENVEERGKLRAPAGDEAEIEAIIAAGNETLAAFEEAAADRSASVDLMSGRSPDPATEFDTLSREYGIERCGGD